MLQINRRQLVQSSAIIGLSAATLAKIVSPVVAGEGKPLAVGNRVLFQGDSITDAGRDGKSDKANNANGLGRGYGVHPTLAGHALMASEWRKVTGI